MSKRKQTANEELANAASHGLGIIFCLSAMPFVLIDTFEKGDLKAFFSMIAFGLGMLLVYSFSTFYHYATNERTKSLLQIGDHISIYFLIAGSYTPMMIKYLSPDMAFIFLSVIWTVVFLGTIFKIFFTKRFKFMSVLLYLVMGWMIVFVIKPLTQTLPLAIFLWILAGGLSYTIGVYFYVKSNKLYYHTIWHIFVLLGTVFHFIAIYKSI